MDKGDKINNLLKDNPKFYCGYVDKDGYNYDSKHELLRNYILKLCGCGQPIETYNFCINILSDIKNINEIIKNDSWNATIFLIHELDRRELIEHGSSILSSWPTNKGKEKCEGMFEPVEFFDILLFMIYLSCDIYDINESIKDDSEKAAKAILNIFKVLELLDENLNLTNDGKYLVNFFRISIIKTSKKKILRDSIL